MNIKSLVKSISKKLGPPKSRAAHGQWTPYAWCVRGLTDRGYGVTQAVRHVLDNSGFANDVKAFGSLRAAFYKVKTLEWPAELVEKDAEEGFE